MHDLLARLEQHYHSSLVPADPSEGASKLDGGLEELCSQALHSVLEP